jgi:hypothetical protein
MGTLQSGERSTVPYASSSRRTTLGESGVIVRDRLTNLPGTIVAGAPATRAFAQRRPALERWLDDHAGARLRVVIGPAGSGKTTGVALWASNRHDPAHTIWVSLPERAPAEALLSLIIARLFERPAHAGSAKPALLVVVDGIDEASEEARGVLARLPGFLPAHVRLIYLQRARFEIATPEDAGRDAFAPPSLLPFDLAEIGSIARARGLAATPTDCEAVLRATGGSAAEVVAAVRFASATATPLIEACVRVRAEAGQPFENALFDGARGKSRPFVPVVANIPRRSPGSMEPAILELFGRFRLRFGEREVDFVRRRDRQIIQYLGLKPDGTATRAELQAAFWPGARRADAARRLRTACSTIRRAISACTGDEFLDAYFRTEGDFVTLRPENVINALTAFDEHLDSARDAQARGDLPAARRHYTAALRLNDRPLLSGEAPAPWIAARARLCEERSAAARASLAAIDP